MLLGMKMVMCDAEWMVDNVHNTLCYMFYDNDDDGSYQLYH